MNLKTYTSISATSLLATLCACAGPTTPLGAVWTVTRPHVAAPGETPRNITAQKAASEELATLPRYGLPPIPPRIHFTPERQVLHGRTSLRVIIDDPTSPHPEDYRIVVRYNGQDVTQAFLLRASVEIDAENHRVTIENPAVRLPPTAAHLIEVYYLSASGAITYAQLGEPRCYAFRPKPVVTLGDFDPSPPILRAIDKISQKDGLNPSFFTALIAQESSFNTRVVSWAKAVGLTQITPSAELDFISKYSDWPRYPGLNDLPVPAVKAMVLSGRINAKNEWKLDPVHSIQGGVDYAVLLAEKWSAPEHLARIRALFPDPEQAHTQLVLASYNSGYNRVLSAFERYGAHWMEAPDLREARRYVNRITSFCDYFSTGPGDDTSSPPTTKGANARGNPRLPASTEARRENAT